MIRDPLDPGTSELVAPVEVAPFGSDVPPELIVVDDQLDWVTTIARFKQTNTVRHHCNSVRACRADWKVWTDYCRRHQVRVLPATQEQIKGFLEEGISALKKRATLERYIATLSLAHRAAHVACPLDDANGRKLVLRTIGRLRQRRKKVIGPRTP